MIITHYLLDIDFLYICIILNIKYKDNKYEYTDI